MTAYVYLATEGPHDVELVAALLRPFGFRRVQHLTSLDPYWRPLIPTTYPHRDDLLARVPVPTFFKGADLSVAIEAVGGDSKLAPRTEDVLALLRGTQPSLGVILDADAERSAHERFDRVVKDLRKLAIPGPESPGIVASGPPRCGIYVLPDNQSPGTFESLLLEAAQTSYSRLIGSATTYVDSVDRIALDEDDMTELNKPAGRDKAIVASVAAILRPGKAIQVSIQDNRWLRDAALDLPRIVQLRRFLAELLALPAMSPAAPAEQESTQRDTAG
jgi:hypothetical protein